MDPEDSSSRIHQQDKPAFYRKEGNSRMLGHAVTLDCLEVVTESKTANMSGVTTSSLSLAWSLRNWVILDYEEVVSLTISPWAPFFSLSFLLMGAQGQGIECVLSRLPLDSGTKTRPTLSRESRSQGTENPFTLESHAWDIINFSAIPRQRSPVH